MREIIPMGEAKRKRREKVPETSSGIEDLMQAQASGELYDVRYHPDGGWEDHTERLQDPTLPPKPMLMQADIPTGLNVFATMEAAWNDLVDRWFHEGMPDKLKQDGKFIFYHGVQAAANLMMYCEGQDMFGAAADQVQGDCIAYEKEAEAVLAERKADEWRTGEI
jgi:hypothetical protein